MAKFIIINCLTCGKKFECRNKPSLFKIGKNKFCSRKCFHHRDIKSKKISFNCLNCKKEFNLAPSEIRQGRGKYCSSDCQRPPIFNNCIICNKEFRIKPSNMKRGWDKYCSSECYWKSMKGRKLSNSTKQKMSQRMLGNTYTKGKPSSLKGRPNIDNRGENHWRWKGEKSTKAERKRLMGQIEYQLWRTAVFVRDNYTCQMCNVRGGKLEADHIKPWALYPELRYAIDNGRTLCVNCHRQTDTWGGRKIYSVERFKG